MKYTPTSASGLLKGSLAIRPALALQPLIKQPFKFGTGKSDLQRVLALNPRSIPSS